jgi:hypothetical protein
MANFCFVDRNGGPVSVKFTATNGLRAHVRCGLFDLSTNQPTPIPNDNHDGPTGAGGEITFILNTPVAQFQGKGFAWRNEACLQIPGTEKASFKVEFFQDGTKLEIKGQSTYTGKYTSCPDGTTQQKGQYEFAFTNLQINELWTLL